MDLALATLPGMRQAMWASTWSMGGTLPTSPDDRNRSVLGDKHSPVTRSEWPVKYLMYLLSCRL